MRKITTCILMLPLLSVSAALADSQMKPGLWEMTMKSDALRNMPKIPPEQIEQMRKMGLAVPQVQDGRIVQKVCVTKELAERDGGLQLQQAETGCQSKNYQRKGNSYTVDVVCNGADLKGEGKARGTFAGNESFASTYDFKGTAHGQPVSQRHENSGKWLSADCGNVKPMEDFAPKTQSK